MALDTVKFPGVPVLHTIAARLARRPFSAGLAAVVLTALFAVPLLTMQPTSSASPEPTGPAFTARDVLDERLAPDIGSGFFLIEAAGASDTVATSAADAPTDLLAPAVLRELATRSDALRGAFADEVATVTDPATGAPVVGLLTIADVVDRQLADLGGLQGAPDAAVTAAVDAVVEQVGPTTLGLSALAERGPDGHWSSPALSTLVLLDNDALGGGNGGPTIGTDDTTREEVLRAVRDVLRGGEAGADVARADAGALVAHAIAADANLTSAEQGQAAGPFIGLVVLLTLLLVGLVFRSYWHVALVGSGISMLMVWLLGSANLVGLEQDQILAVVVPIALVSFGVDFAFHALGRVREEREAGGAPLRALTVGLAGVGSALLLALASDTAAFLSNVFSGIESIVQFGIAAALGLTAAFLLLGVVAPVVESAIADRVAPPPAGRRATATRLLGMLTAASAAMGAVLLTVYVAPAVGVVVTLAGVLLFVVLPCWWRSRDAATAAATGTTPQAPTLHDGPVARWLGGAALAVARRGAVVLPLVAVVTVVAGWSALQVEAEFDVEDFFSAETDFVAGLNALDVHVGDSGGEPLDLVVTTDLEDPAAVARLAREVDELRALDSVFATGDDGETLVEGGVVDLLRDAVALPPARAAVEASGVTLADDDGDGIPDTREGVVAVYDVATTTGLPLDDEQLLWAPAQVTPLLDRGADGLDAGRMTLQLPGSRGVTVIEQAIEVLGPRTAALTTDLGEVADGSTATATGSPIVRQLSLEAVTRALLLSLPIAILACLAVALVAMRSLRFAVIAIVPILLVVPWLYGLMHALGFSINLVTGTIGAISIGIGIDFAIHLVERFREERTRRPDRDDALRATAEGTGLALVASAASSVVGFGVLAFAPMPLFASYGLLTSMMVAMALVATLLVLPALLRATTPADPDASRTRRVPVSRVSARS